MGFDNTFFPYFNKFCIDKLGADIGRLIIMESENKLSNIIREADYRNNKYTKWHMDSNMLPTMAMYI